MTVSLLIILSPLYTGDVSSKVLASGLKTLKLSCSVLGCEARILEEGGHVLVGNQGAIWPASFNRMSRNLPKVTLHALYQ